MKKKSRSSARVPGNKGARPASGSRGRPAEKTSVGPKSGGARKELAKSERQRPGTPTRARGISTERMVVGRHAVHSFLKQRGTFCVRLHLQNQQSDADEIVTLAREQGVDVQYQDRERLAGLAGAELVHQGFVLETRGFPYVDIEDVLDRELVLVLDGVEDPRNLGAAARAAFTLGAGALVIPARRAASVTATAQKSAAGALAMLDVAQVENLGRALEKLKASGFWLVGAEADGATKPWEIDCRGKIALVIGGEDRGLRRLTRENCDFVTSIPMAAADFSLNAADAATVLLYEVLRQRSLGAG